MVSGDNYKQLFYDKETPSQTLVDPNIWDKIAASVPDDYLIPDFRMTDVIAAHHYYGK
ncbi:hypothetical protein [Paenibacillus turpanensis]|uniref:hypothetical protein n=1 Tax=Paenibacillus turpanensis TaxID=2689078 RepID=UPI00140A099B|nr:hypothetical protein [Paenibacillus turpanensis]